MAFNPNYPIFGREPLNHKTGVTREMFIKELGKLYNKPTDRAYLQALGLTQEEINQIVPMPQGTCSLRYPTFADKNRKL